MRRISTATKVVDKFGTGKHGFTNGNAVGGVAATDLEDVWFDHVQEELATFIEAAGLALDSSNRSQLLASVQKFLQAGAMNVGVDTGSANVYAVAYAPAITALTDGMVLWFKAKTANTGASTLNVNGLGAQPLVGGSHSALQGGEVVANGKCQVVWNATISSFVLVECTGGALQVAAGSQSNHAPSLSQFLGVLSATGYFKIPVMVSGVLRTVIVQWGGATVAGGAGQAVATFPIAFPNGFLGDVSFAGNGNVVVSGVSATLSTRTYLLTVGNTAGAAANGIQCSYIAIGW